MNVLVSLPCSISSTHGHELLKILKATGQPQCFVPSGSASRFYFSKQAIQEE